MRSPPETYALSFILPAKACGLAPPVPGRHEPKPRTILEIGEPTEEGIPVSITSWSRVQCQDHARTFLKLHTKGAAPFAILAWLDFPPSWPGGTRGRSPWWIAVNSEISFSPAPIGSMDLDPVEPKPRLKLVGA